MLAYFHQYGMSDLAPAVVQLQASRGAPASRQVREGG
jgi:hypothetical protein